MYAVGRLGSYISRGVANTVSGPFQGGAVDIIVVEQPDGSFKSSPWYVRFGKSQGSLKPEERIVRVKVNGVNTDFRMCLDNKGDAVFLLEVYGEEGDFEGYSCLGHDVVSKSDLRIKIKSRSCNYDSSRRDFVPNFEANEGKIVPRTNSPRNRYVGFPVDARSNKECCLQGDGTETFRKSSENVNCNGNEISSCNTKNSNMEEICNVLNGVNNKNSKFVPSISSLRRSNVDIGREATCSSSEECLGGYSGLRNASGAPSETSDDDQFSFSDLDEPTTHKVERKRHHPRDHSKGGEDKDDELLKEHEVMHNSKSSPISISYAPKNSDLDYYHPNAESLPNMPFVGDNINPEGAPDMLGRSLDSNFEALSIAEVQRLSESGSEKQRVPPVQPKNDGSNIPDDIKRIISDRAVEVSLCRHLLREGMGYEAAAAAFDAEKLDAHRFSSLCPDIVNDDKLVVRIGGLYFPWDDALPITSKIGVNENEQFLEPKGMIAVGQSHKTSPGGQHKSQNSKNGSWKIWPFTFKRSTGVVDKDLSSETAPQKPLPKEGNEELAMVIKKTKRAKAPTSEQLRFLNLKEGKNVVTFTFSTATQGDQQLDARIFLWKWNSRIVISDVDGTITKSDVLGQFMPLMGYDWSQTGVTRLFSAIKENGYHLLFLSARSILQASLTRQFLINLTQDGKTLPEGPVVISPDGIFPSLYREVIRRAPHEFKIACLEDIRALYPQDHNPFYAGFGNRETDEFSYLKIGIPRGKIFTINPKGQVVVNRRVDTKSYTSLHDYVHGMFPETPITEQEDYNNWNFWRLPPPDICL